MSSNAPIGVFDSGFGGLTVARELVKVLPHESLIYVGDSARCPYGPRSEEEVRSFVLEICGWLVAQGVKLIVIACNTATAAGLACARQHFDVPILGVIEPGARGAAAATRSKRVGVIATKGTVESGSYSKAIRAIDGDITVFSVATPRFVEIVEQGIRISEGPIEDLSSSASSVYIRPAFREIAKEYLEPIRRVKVDTLVLGCTHFPLLKALIGGVIGKEVKLISSATETAADVCRVLQDYDIACDQSEEEESVSKNVTSGALAADSLALKKSRFGVAGKQNSFACETHMPEHFFYTTGLDVGEFRSFGSRVFKTDLKNVFHLNLQTGEYWK